MVPSDRRYSTKHVWAKTDAEMFLIGVSEHFLRPIKNILYVDLAEEDDPLFDTVAAGEIEHLDGVSDVFPPGNCTVIEANTSVIDDPNILVHDPYNKGWLLRVDMDDPEVYDSLMNAQEYEAFVKTHPVKAQPEQETESNEE